MLASWFISQLLKAALWGQTQWNARWEEASTACVLNKIRLYHVPFPAFGKAARQAGPCQGPAGRQDPCSVPPSLMEELWSVHRWFWVEEEGGQKQEAQGEHSVGARSRLPKGPLGAGQCHQLTLVCLGLYWF